MMRRLALLLIPLTTPAWADIPGIDRTVLDERQDRGDKTASIEKLNRERRTINKSLTCSLYRPARKDDAVAAANANPAIAGLVRRIAREEGIDENQFLALVYQESRFNPCARSGAGAIGLAQLMPGTASDLGVNPGNIEQNLRGGARYFKQQLQHFGGNVPMALAAYNAGSGNVEKYAGVPPFRETQAYVRNITGKWLPAFGGADKSGIALNYGGAGTAYDGMASSTITAMALTNATDESSGDVASWLTQLGSATTGTLQDSWDQNSAARNANTAMLNNMLSLSASFADLANSNNAVTLSDISGANRSGRYHTGTAANPHDAAGLCEERPGLVWDTEAKACVQNPGQNHRLLLTPQ